MEDTSDNPNELSSDLKVDIGPGSQNERARYVYIFHIYIFIITLGKRVYKLMSYVRNVVGSLGRRGLNIFTLTESQVFLLSPCC